MNARRGLARALVDPDDIPSTMMGYWQIVAVLENLQDVLERGVDGDVVELGCNIGTTSIYLRKMLDAFGSRKQLHVYDSWQGLPDKHRNDVAADRSRSFEKGWCRTSRASLVESFEARGLALPVIHSGWFADIPDDEYPDPICFAFFDGDFYTSIRDSFAKTFHKMTPGGVVIVDDCGWDVLPGVQRACEELLAGRPETLDLTAYPDAEGRKGGRNGGGRIVKLA
jgi:O-methyltransferase